MSIRVLWVTPTLPSLLSGTSVRQLNLIKLLAPRVRFTVLSFLTEQERPFVRELGDLCHELYTVDVPPWISPGCWRNRLRSLVQTFLDPLPLYARTYPVEAMRPVLRRLLQHDLFDVVHFVSLYPTRLRLECSNVPTTLTAMDVESTKQWRLYKQEARLPRKIQKFVEWVKLRHFEQQWVGRYDAVAAMSDVDREQLGKWVNDIPLFVIPNGVDADRFVSAKAHPRQERRLVFIGNMGYAPNVQGILYFCDQILPIVRSKVPDVELDIVGPNAAPEVEGLESIPGVHLTGFADVRPYLWRRTLSIVPLLAGSGTRLKIVESMAAGCPVVSTSVGAEGLGLEHGRDILLADEPQGFAHWVVELMSNDILWQALSQSGKEKVRSEYDWHLIAPKLLRMLQSAIDRYHGR